MGGSLVAPGRQAQIDIYDPEPTGWRRGPDFLAWETHMAVVTMGADLIVGAA